MAAGWRQSGISSADAEKTLERAKRFQGEGLASLDAALE